MDPTRLSPLFRNPAILVYGRDGAIVKTYERIGGGPGEFMSPPQLLRAPGDTLLAVADGRLARFAAPDLVHVATHPLSIDIG